MNTDIENEIPKYRKKSQSNNSKAKRKYNHKHQNKECLLIKDEFPYLAHYCVICGKIIKWDWCLEKCEGGYRELNKEEVFKKYNDLEQYTVEDLFTKYLPVNEKGNKP